MRTETFVSNGLEPIGEGEENKVFVDPENPDRVIAERKEGAEKESSRQAKGRYYLTKIVHALLPDNIPDVYQSTMAADGQQTIVRERVAHSEGQVNLQDVRKKGEDEAEAGRALIEEMGTSMQEIALKLEDIGLGFGIDENAGNYTKDAAGNVRYLESFLPWRIDPSSPDGLERLFDSEALRSAIRNMPEMDAQQQCEGYLQRLEALVADERQERGGRAEVLASKEDPKKAQLEASFILFELNHPLDALFAITTMEEALSSEARRSAKSDLGPLLSQLNDLSDRGVLSVAQYGALAEKFQKLSCAVGMINGGKVDHEVR